MLLQHPLQGFGSIATKIIVATHAKLWQYVPIATKRLSLASVAIGHMVIGYRNKKAIMAVKCVIATTMRVVATVYHVAALT
jgi:hypothetical protein